MIILGSRGAQMRTERTTPAMLPGLNVQAPWAESIVRGKKTIETRFYPLPQKYVGEEMFLIETPGERLDFKARIIAIVIFNESFRYRDSSHFYRDSKRHLVTRQSELVNWEAGHGKPKWGWPIISVRRYSQDLPPTLRRGIVYSTSIPLSP